MYGQRKLESVAGYVEENCTDSGVVNSWTNERTFSLG